MIRAFSSGVLQTFDRNCRCALGRGGVVAAQDKREGDLATPLAVMPLRAVYYRPDRLAPPQTALPLRALTPDMGWCDAPDDPAYNRAVAHPYPASAERLWREDHVYDVIVTLGWNDDPVIPGRGSAIFWHLARPDFSGTEGCIAVSLEDMLHALTRAKPGDALEVVRAETPP